MKKVLSIMKKVLQCIHLEKSIHKKVLSRTTLNVISFSELKPIQHIQVSLLYNHGHSSSFVTF